MGDKIEAKRTAKRLGIPCVPGSEGGVTDEDEAKRIASDIGYPVLIKAAAGGGGRGMKVARTRGRPRPCARHRPRPRPRPPSATTRSISRSTSRSRAISRSRCSATARATPSISASATARCSAATRRSGRKAPRRPSTPRCASASAASSPRRCRSCNIAGAGTIEFLYEDGEFYFIEMNTRIQVEHPVTEMITGIDLVNEQIRVAAGAPLSVRQEDIRIEGHAIECRINAEHPATFRPSPGTITYFHPPGGLGVRVDSAAYQGYRIPPTTTARRQADRPWPHPQRVPDAAAPRARRVRGRRHRDHPAAPRSGAWSRNPTIPERRLRHPLAGEFRHRETGGRLRTSSREGASGRSLLPPS